MFDEDKGTLLRSIYTSSDGNVEQLNEPIHGFVDDYAFLIQGLLDLYHATFDEKWIIWADQLQIKQNQLFWDEKGKYSVIFNTSTVETVTKKMILAQNFVNTKKSTILTQ